MRRRIFLREFEEQNRELQKQLSEVARERALIDAISGSMNEGLLLLDKEGHVSSVNQSARSILSVHGNPVGRYVLEVVRNVEMIKRIETANAGTGSDTALELAGRIYHAIFSPTADGVLILLLDITERANAEKRRREFSANVSHELKTPLTTISGYAELLESGMVGPADIPEAAGKIRHETMRLIALIEDIMRLSELDESESPVEFAECDLCEIARGAAENLTRKASDAGVTVTAPSDTVTVNASRNMMFELFYNLIDNGIKYNRPRGKVNVAVVKEAEKVRMSVSDTGIGIDKKYLDRIFERFYRVDKSRSKATGGTGLGLSIVKHIVACHHGTIHVESEPGVGTTVDIEITVC
ncbi:MAG: ATP-binding protein [Firmicutes bacterium]|nr:ATP-binding protein [Bacillota bacterium]